MPAPVHRSAWFVALAALGVALALWFGRRYQTTAQIARARRALSRAVETKADVLAACTHPEFGQIDFRWGNEKEGIAHIIKRTTERLKPFPNGPTPEQTLARVPDILFNGTGTQLGPRKVHIEKDGYRVVLAYDYHGKKSPAWVLNALDIHPTKQKRSR